MPLLPIDVSTWALHEDFPFHPVGSKPKRVLRAPETGELPSNIVRGHTYLFKTAVAWQRQQVWSEVVAYGLSRILKPLYVPRAMIAFDGRTGETGVLVQFFYGFPGEVRPARLFHASEMIAKLHSQSSGRPHNFVENQRICRIVIGSARFDPDWWVKAATFDALIGNGDRHSQNWGFLVRTGDRGEAIYSMAPYYDNGSSLGYELTDNRCDELLSSSRQMEAYINKGRHNIGWDMRSDFPTGHFELMEKLIKSGEAAGVAVRNMVSFDDALIEPLVTQYSEYEAGISFSPLRAAFVSALLKARLTRLRLLVDE